MTPLPKRSSRDRESLAAFLPHDSFDPNGNVFVGRDRSLGLAWEIGMPHAEVLSDHEFDLLSQRFAELLRHVPGGAAVQWILRSNRDPGKRLAVWEKASAGRASAANDLFSSHARILRGLSIDDDGHPFSTRRLELYLTLRVFPKLSGSDESLGTDYLREKEKLIGVASRLEGAFLEMKLRCERLSGDTLKALLYEFLNPSLASRQLPAPYRPDLPLRHQVVRSESKINWRTGGICLDGLHHRIVSMAQTPLETYWGMLLDPQAGSSVGR